MASIHAHPRSPFWMAHFFKDGRRTTKSTRVPSLEENRAKAQAIADTWERAAAMAGQGRDGREWMLSTLNSIFGEKDLPTVTKQVETFDGVAARWLKTAAKRRQVAPATIELYKRVVKSFSSYLGVRTSKDITAVATKDIDAWLEKLAESNSASTARHRLLVLRGVFAFAVKHGVIDRNPALAVETPKANPATREPFTAKEVGKMIVQARAEGGDMQTLFLLGLCTGARLMDCASMRWDAVDLDAGRLSYIPRKKRRTGHAATVSLVDPLLGHLRDAKRSSAFLCPSLQSYTASHVSRLFADFMARAGVAGSQVKTDRARVFHTKSFHALRHTVATLLAEAGVDELVRRRITDHEDKKVAEIYSHVSVESTGRALNQVLAPFQSNSRTP